ncbi:uncharacterized protein LOC119674887 [Teleopsis dalmanni]|uniref:uncharacterized protein LOC119674887 n=1 Tax=Teleopsis dalmanni TaxID=139649 RepID=UPI0018CE07B3|nr:uncharacterized protein LOC119674887 [Teleopsis dalmanni]
MSKIECLSVDKNLSEFEYCRLKPINRNVSEFSFKLKLHDTINDLTANYELLQKFNRYSPIGINYTLNICKYFTNRKNEKFVTIFFDLMNNYINLNHSCPFKDYIQLEKFYARHDRLPLPILSGEYLFKTSWFVKQKLRVQTEEVQAELKDAGAEHCRTLQKVEVPTVRDNFMQRKR